MRSNEFAADAEHVPFDQLPDIGFPNLRLVDGQLMDREQYDVCDYRLEGTYTPQGTDRKVPIWRASLVGLQNYGRLRHQRSQERHAAYLAREEEDRAMNEWIDELEDAKPVYKKGDE